MGAKSCLIGVTTFSWSELGSSTSISASWEYSRSRRCRSLGKSSRGLIEVRVKGQRRGETGPSISVSSELLCVCASGSSSGNLRKIFLPRL